MPGNAKKHAGEMVVILHGIGMRPLRMAFVDLYLKSKGYKTLNLGYPSTRVSLSDCAAFVAGKIQTALTPEIEKVHIVTHSMGGLVALHLMAEQRSIKITRAVLVAPPYGGSEVMDFLQKWSVTKKIYGPAGEQLTTSFRQNAALHLPDNTDVGVIAGTRGYEYPMFLSLMKPYAPHDGLVSVASTRIPGLTHHIEMGMSHSFLIERSVSQINHFLEHGQFRKTHEASQTLG